MKKKKIRTIRSVVMQLALMAMLLVYIGCGGSLEDSLKALLTGKIVLLNKTGKTIIAMVHRYYTCIIPAGGSQSVGIVVPDDVDKKVMFLVHAWYPNWGKLNNEVERIFFTCFHLPYEKGGQTIKTMTVNILDQRKDSYTN